MLIALAILIIGGASTSIMAQDETDTGLWNEVTITKAVNKNVDVFAGGRYETKANNSETQEYRVYGGLVFKKSKWIFQPLFNFVRSANRAGRYYNEDRPSFIVNRKFNKKGSKWTVAPGLRTEYRIRTGKNDFRFVPNVSVERALNAKTKFFNRNELWMDTRKADPTQYRLRFFFGVSRVVNKNLTVEPFYMFQLDQKFAPYYVHKFGIYWKFKL